MTTILFIGDLVGAVSADYLEAQLPALRARWLPDFIIANAENMALGFAPHSPGMCGMTPELNGRLFALGIDVLTGGNHSWDGAYGRTIHDDPRVLRPLNYGEHAPGRGACIIEKAGVRLGVINLMSRTAMNHVDHPLDAFDRQMTRWAGAVDLVVVDFHGESVTEKQTFAFAADGRAAAVLGTHTHVQTNDLRVLPGGTAFVSDVGMTGPGGGIQGYQPELFVNSMRLRLPDTAPFAFATGAIELGAVVVHTAGGRAASIQRVMPVE
jgi:metallophosphoesterase (TIGR00282 family)